MLQIHLVGRNGIGSDPLVAGVFVEVVARIQRLVDQIGIEVIQLGSFFCFIRRSCSGLTAELRVRILPKHRPKGKVSNRRQR